MVSVVYHDGLEECVRYSYLVLSDGAVDIFPDDRSGDNIY